MPIKFRQRAVLTYIWVDWRMFLYPFVYFNYSLNLWLWHPKRDRKNKDLSRMLKMLVRKLFENKIFQWNYHFVDNPRLVCNSGESVGQQLTACSVMKNLKNECQTLVQSTKKWDSTGGATLQVRRMSLHILNEKTFPG